MDCDVCGRPLRRDSKEGAHVRCRPSERSRVYGRDWARKNRDPEAHKVYTRDWYRSNPERYLLIAARGRAKKQGLEFTITLADVVIPEFCPLLGIKLQARWESAIDEVNRGSTASSPSLDRKNPKLGYVPGNVWVISHRANTMKQDAQVEEIELLARNLRKHTRPKLRLVGGI